MVEVLNWPDVLSILGNEGDSVFPNAKQALTAQTKPPFMAVYEEDQVDVDGIVQSLSYGFWVYDAPEESYWRINRLHRLIRGHMEGLDLSPSSDGVLDPFAFEFKSGEARDDQLDKLVKFARYRTWLVAP